MERKQGVFPNKFISQPPGQTGGVLTHWGEEPVSLFWAGLVLRQPALLGGPLLVMWVQVLGAGGLMGWLPADSSGRAGSKTPRELLTPSRPLTHISHFIDTQQYAPCPLHFYKSSQTPCFYGLFCHVEACACMCVHTQGLHTLLPPFTPLPQALQTPLTPIPSSTLLSGMHAHSPTRTHCIYKYPTPLLPPRDTH